MSAQLTVILWRDIPGQVVASSGRVKARSELSSRFQEAIDAAAMRAGMEGTDAYLEQWRRESRPCGADLKAEADAEVARLEAAWTDEALVELIRADGVAAAPETEA